MNAEDKTQCQRLPLPAICVPLSADKIQQLKVRQAAEYARCVYLLNEAKRLQQEFEDDYTYTCTRLAKREGKRLKDPLTAKAARQDADDAIKAASSMSEQK